MGAGHRRQSGRRLNFLMENGQIVLTGSGQEPLHNEHLQARYLGA